jgi:hypothetical protein
MLKLIFSHTIFKTTIIFICKLYLKWTLHLCATVSFSVNSRLSMRMTFFYINADTCELAFWHLSAPTLGGQLALGGSTEDVVEQYFFLVLYGWHQWWGGEVCSNAHGGGERGCYKYAWSFSNISVLQSIPLHYTVHQLGENDS